MMKTQHTKGEWKIIQPIDDEDYLVIKSDIKDLHICEILKGAYTIDKKETEANAKLIAAAPDLLESCQYVVDWHREHDDGSGELFGLDFVTTCISAIRKATT